MAWGDLWNVVWLFFWIFAFLACLMAIFSVVAARFRDHEVNGWANALLDEGTITKDRLAVLEQKALA